MRAALATVIDVLLMALIAYLAFRLAVAAAPCRYLGGCTLLTPLAILFMLIGLALYLGLGFLLWRTSPGRALTRS